MTKFRQRCRKETKQHVVQSSTILNSDVISCPQVRMSATSSTSISSNSTALYPLSNRSLAPSPIFIISSSCVHLKTIFISSFDRLFWYLSFQCFKIFTDLFLFLQVSLHFNFSSIFRISQQFLADRSLDHSYSGGLSSYCLVSFFPY